MMTALYVLRAKLRANWNGWRQTAQQATFEVPTYGTCTG